MAYWPNSHLLVVTVILGYPPQQTILFVFCYLKHHFLDSCDPLFTGNMSVHTQGNLQKQNESEQEKGVIIIISTLFIVTIIIVLLISVIKIIIIIIIITIFIMTKLESVRNRMVERRGRQNVCV